MYKKKIKACFKKWRGGGGCSSGVLKFWIDQPITKNKNEKTKAHVCMRESDSDNLGHIIAGQT